MNKGWIYTDKINRQSGGAGQTVLAYYTQRYTHSDQAIWQTRIELGQILLDGQQTTPQTYLDYGQVLTYHRPPWQEPNVPLAFEVLYEDESLWAIAKPAGLPVLPGGGFLEHTLLHQMQQRYSHYQPVPVHRLGRGTSGVMLVAKSQSARTVLSQQFRQRTRPMSTAVQPILVKRYRALIGPTTPVELPDTFICNTPIGKYPYPKLGYVFAAAIDEGSGKPARSVAQVLQRRSASTLLSIEIETGRPHQIRIHMAAKGYPLLGDPLYRAGGLPIATGEAIPSDCGYQLHAYQIQFQHPVSKKAIEITAPPPDLLQVRSPQRNLKLRFSN